MAKKRADVCSLAAIDNADHITCAGGGITGVAGDDQIYHQLAVDREMYGLAAHNMTDHIRCAGGSCHGTRDSVTHIQSVDQAEWQRVSKERATQDTICIAGGTVTDCTAK